MKNGAARCFIQKLLIIANENNKCTNYCVYLQNQIVFIINMYHYNNNKCL